MELRGSIALKLCLCLVAAAPAALPGTPPTLSANPSAVDFQYSPPQQAPEPVIVGVTASDASTPSLTVTQTPAKNTPAALFQITPEGLNISVGIDVGTLNTLVTQPPGIYTSMLTIAANGFTSIQVPLTISVNAELAIVPMPASLTFTAPSGQTVQTINLSGTSQTSVGFTFTATISSGTNWLTVTANASATPATLTVTVNPLNIGAGTYTGNITVTPSIGGTLVIPITFQVGTSTLTVTPTTLAFAFTIGGTTPPAETVQLTDTIAKNTFVAQAASTGNWLLVNGATANVSGPLPATLNVTVSPSGLAAGTYQGTITVTDGNNSTQVVSVSLIVSGISTVANPTALVFLAQTGIAPAAQPVQINGFTTYSNYSVQVNSPWLSVSSTAGPAPAQITVSANPTNLAVGTYTGNLTVNLNAHIQVIFVTFIVSANPVLGTKPGGLVFAYTGGSPPPTPQTLAVAVSSGSAQSFTIASATPAWLQVAASTSSLNTPTILTVTLAPQSLPTGTYLAQIILTPVVAPGINAISTIIPVVLTVADAPAVTTNVTSLTFNAAAGGTPQTATFGVTAPAPLSFTATTSTTTTVNWLSVSPVNATTGLGYVTLTVTADPSTLSAGPYQGTVILTTPGGVITSVPVTFNVSASGETVTVTPTSLAFTYTAGGTVPAAQSVQVNGAPTFTASTSTSTGANWLAVSPTSGSGNTTLSVSVSPASLAQGTYTGTVTVNPAGSAVQTVAVTLTVSPQATLAATPTTLSFSYTSNNPPPAAQTVVISSLGAATQFTASATSSGWLSITPSGGTTPTTLTVSVDPSLLGGGTYSGSIAVSAGAGSLQLNVPVTITVNTSLPSIQSVVSAASYATGGIAPGEIVVVFGNSLGPVAGQGAQIVNGFIPTTLDTVQVTFNGFAGPILYAGAGQINTIVPYELSGASNVAVEVIFGSSRSNTMTVPLATTAPGIFSADASGKGAGALLDANYHLISSSNPVSAGGLIQIFATGQGLTAPAEIDGEIEPVVPPFPAPILASTATVTIGNQPAEILYIGAAPGLVAGALQIDVTLPSGVTPGAAPLVISIGGNSSQSLLTVAVQ